MLPHQHPPLLLSWVLVSKDQTLRGSAAFLLTAGIMLVLSPGPNRRDKGILVFSQQRTWESATAQQFNRLAKVGFALNLIAALSTFCSALQPAEVQK